MTQIENLAIARIEYLVDRATFFAKNGDNDLKDFFLSEAKTLTDVMSDGSDILWFQYHRWNSDSFGVAFELQHGDEELMFGGV